MNTQQQVDLNALCEQWNANIDRQRVFQTIYKQFSRAVYLKAVIRGLSHEDAEDVVQECFIALAQQRTLEKIWGFLSTVAHHKSRNVIRTNANARKRDTAYSEHGTTKLSDSASRPEDQEILDKVLDAVNTLDSRRRELMTLKYLGHRPTKTKIEELARELGVSRRTFYNLHDSAIEKLRRTLREQGIAPAFVLVSLKHFASIHVPDGLEQRVIDAIDRVVDWNHGKNTTVRRNRLWTKSTIGVALVVVSLIIGYLATTLLPNHQTDLTGERVTASEALDQTQDIQVAGALPQPETADTPQPPLASASPEPSRAIMIRCVDGAGAPVAGAYVLAANVPAGYEAASEQNDTVRGLPPGQDSAAGSALVGVARKGTDNELNVLSLQTDAGGVVELPDSDRLSSEDNIWLVVAVVPDVLIGTWSEERDSLAVEIVLLEMVPTITKYVAVDVLGDGAATGEPIVGIERIGGDKGKAFLFPRRLAAEIASRSDLADRFAFLRDRSGTRVIFDNMPMCDRCIGTTFFAKLDGFDTAPGIVTYIGSAFLLVSRSVAISNAEKTKAVGNLFGEISQERESFEKSAQHGSQWN